LRSLPELSIDYALAERAERMCCVRATFRWDDLGAWDALERLFPPDADGNIVQGNVVLLDCSGCIVLDARTGSSSLLTLLGMRDCVVVLTDDAQLICPKAQAQRGARASEPTATARLRGGAVDGNAAVQHRAVGHGRRRGAAGQSR
jgi:hypothetical protein